jgi:hypothetical protein
MNYDNIYTEALNAAKAAESAYMEAHGEPMYCGFAWVDISSARIPVVGWCKKNNVGRKHWQKGWCIWNPAGNGTQSMDVKEAGAYAFAEVLRKHGISAYAGSRAD